MNISDRKTINTQPPERLNISKRKEYAAPTLNDEGPGA